MIRIPPWGASSDSHPPVGVGVLDDPVQRVVPLARCVGDADPVRRIVPLARCVEDAAPYGGIGP